MVKHVLLVLCILSPLTAKKIFLKEHILQYLNKDNPFFYKTVGQVYIRQAEEEFALGTLDTHINAQYDDKRYPVTDGTYQNIDISKPLISGIELSVAYRRAQGTQEANNIITAQDGEMLAGIKVPVFALFNDISKQMVDIGKARLQTQHDIETSRVNINILYMKIFQAYYQILLYKELVATEKGLLNKAIKNKKFIKKHIEIGKLPLIALPEVEALEVGRRQRFIYSRNAFINAKNIFLQYIGIAQERFDKKFTIPSLSYKLPSPLSKKSAWRIAIENRSELKQIDYKEKENALNREFNVLEKMPKFNVGLYGAYDLQQNEGYKVTFDLSMPLERRRYKGRDEALRKEALLLDSKRSTIIREITTKIDNILIKMKMIKEAIKLSKREIVLAQKVENAEKKKFKEGVSTLIFVNQREMKTLHTKQKLLKYYYSLLILGINLDFEIGIESKRLRLE